MRQLILFALVVAALVASLWARPASPPAEETPSLAYVTTAHQPGVVGYRDPAGAISPDGKLFAYAEGRFIRVVPIGGGAPITLAAGEGQVRFLAWKGNDEIVAEDATASGRWWKYPLGETGRRPLWNQKLADEPRQIAFSADGRWAAALFLTKAGPELSRMGEDGATPEVTKLQGRVSFPAFRSTGQIACVIDARLSIPCGSAATKLNPDREINGPIAFAPDGNAVYFASPNDRGFVELWSADLTSGRAGRV